MNSDSKFVPGTAPPDFAVLYAKRDETCKHEQVNPRSEGQHDNVGGNCAICKQVFAKSMVELVDGRLAYKPFVYEPATTRKRSARRKPGF